MIGLNRLSAGSAHNGNSSVPKSGEACVNVSGLLVLEKHIGCHTSAKVGEREEV